jgi:hypothetical protein
LDLSGFSEKRRKAVLVYVFFFEIGRRHAGAGSLFDLC